MSALGWIFRSLSRSKTKRKMYISTQMSGQFSASEQLGHRVVSLSSDQDENTLLVCGHSSGWLQVWAIRHFAGGDQHQVTQVKENRDVCHECILLFCLSRPVSPAARQAASSAEVLKGSQCTAAQRGCRPGGPQVVCPGGISGRLHVTVDK